MWLTDYSKLEGLLRGLTKRLGNISSGDHSVNDDHCLRIPNQLEFYEHQLLVQVLIEPKKRQADQSFCSEKKVPWSHRFVSLAETDTEYVPPTDYTMLTANQGLK